MTQQYRLKRQIFKGDQQAPLAEHARDTQQLLGQVPVTELRIVESIYTEPMVLGQLKEEPFCIELVRIVNLSAATNVVRCGGMVHFIWLPVLNGAQILSIDGLSPGFDGTTRFRFYYRITYKLE